MRRDRPADRRRGGSVRRHRHPVALHGAPSAAHCRSIAARGNPGALHTGVDQPDVAGRSFLALLYCADEGLSASRFAEYLGLGQMHEDEEPRTPALWERLLVDAAVIGGPSVADAPPRPSRGDAPPLSRGAGPIARAQNRRARESGRAGAAHYRQARGPARPALFGASGSPRSSTSRSSRCGTPIACSISSKNSNPWPTSARSVSARCCSFSVRG